MIVGVEGLALQRSSLEALYEKAFDHFEAYFGVIDDIDATVALIEMLSTILSKLGRSESSQPLRARLSGDAGAALKRKWEGVTVKVPIFSLLLFFLSLFLFPPLPFSFL